MKHIIAAVISFLSLYSSAQVAFQASVVDGCSPIGLTIEVTSPPATDISSYLWEITTPSGNIITSVSPVYVAIFTEGGGYDVSLTINGTDNVSIQDYIVVHDNPVANFSINDGQGCFPFCVDFTDLTVSGGGNIVSWSWDFGNGVTSTMQSPNYCYQDPGLYTPVFSVQDEFGCFDDVSVPGLISVSDQFPTAVLSAGYQLSCAPPVDFSFSNASFGVSNLNYIWDFGDGNLQTSLDAQDVIHSYGSTGIFDVCLTAIDEIGCENQACVPIEVFDQAQAVFDVSATTVCLGDSINFTDLTQPTPVQWSWDFNGDGVEDSNQQNPAFVYQSEGVFSPSLTVTYTDNCWDTESMLFNIDVQPPLVVDFVADSMASCQTPLLVNFSNTTSGPGSISYEWFINGASVATSTDLAYNFSNFSSNDVELIATSSSGCTASQLYPGFIQLIEPSVSFSNPTVICTDDPVLIFNIETNTLDPIVEWNWDFNQDNVIDYTGPNPNYSYTSTGEYIISLDILTESGCFTSFTNSQSITVETQVNTDFTVLDTVICAGDFAEFCVTEQPGVSYSWNYGDGAGWDNYQSWEICAHHFFSDTGYFDISLSVFNEGCSHLVTYENLIYVNGPIALFDYTQSCADMFTVEFFDNSILAEEVSWDFGDGSPPVVGPIYTTHTFPGLGSYYVTLTATNAVIGCTDTQTALVEIIAPNPTLLFTQNSGCPPLEVIVNNVEDSNHWEVDFGNGDYVNVQWNDISNSWDVEWTEQGVLFTEAFGINENFWPTPVYTEMGTYDVTVYVEDENGCSNSAVFNSAVIVNSSLDFAVFDINIIEGCSSVDIEFIPTATNLTTWQWTFSDSTVVNNLNPIHTFLPPYDYDLYATFEATNNIGCISISTQQIPLAPPATPIFTVISDPSCQGDSIQISNDSWGDIVSYTWDFGDPTDVDNNISYEELPNHTYQNNGSFEICLTVENSMGCQTTLCQGGVVNIVNPVADFIYDVNINNCLFGVQFENTTPGNVECSDWYFGDGQLGVGTQVYHTYSIGVYDLELVVCNEFGCTDTIVAPDIFEYSNVIGPYAVSEDSVSCAPMSVDFSSWNINDVDFSYFWDFGDGFGDPNGSTQTSHVYEVPGTYCPSLIMTDANGCPVLIECENPILVEELTITMSGLDEICYGDSLLLGVSGASTYQWLDESFITTVNDTLFYLHPSQTTNFQIDGFYADCETNQNFDLIVNQLPEVALVMDDQICIGIPIFDLIGGTPNDLPGTYYVDGVESTQFDPSQSVGDTFNILYDYTDVNGCQSSASLDVSIVDLPTVTLNPFAPLCENDNPLTLTGGNPVAGVYTIDTTATISFDPQLGVGLYPVEYTYTDENGCAASDAQELEVLPVPNIVFSVPEPCLNDGLVVINETSVEGGNISAVSWDFDGLFSSDLYSPDPVEVVNGGAFNITQEATADNGCVSSLTQTIDLFAAPVADFSFSNDCVGSIFNLDDISTIPTGTLASWNWDLGELGLFNTQIVNQAIGVSGTYDLVLTVVSDNGCEDSITQSLEVYPAPEIAFDVIDGCEGNEATFINLSDISLGEISSYSWDLGDGNTSDLFEPNNSYQDVGLYQVILTATSAQGCVDSLSQDVQIFAPPVADFMVSDSAFCSGHEIVISDLSTVDDQSYINQWQWVINNQTVGYTQELNYFFEDSGLYDITLTVMSNNGCSDQITAEEVVEVWPYPVADFDFSVWEGDLLNTTMAFEDHSQGSVAWSYDFGDGNISDEINPTHFYEHYGPYNVWQVVTNEFGCSDSLMQRIEINPEMLIYVPNSFTPDFDGRNDVFKPEITGFSIKQYTFQVFNRWGELLFETHDLDQGWMGDVNGGTYFVPNGTYVWRIVIQNEYSFELKELSGSVSVFR